ncbi:hypothetical protein XCR1_2940008 [Xenorhabdus cabanillasii JM26]|uniref:Uncharacterized protein n=1 Tax=Xenorhabdus cabanillasii JM26 TaxID=1427517 RepID=W1J8C9_9GAMM|nr:hypothetical protein XCR1_2940008 [Xenorhabdus cabanillasii JM26]
MIIAFLTQIYCSLGIFFISLLGDNFECEKLIFTQMLANLDY